MENKRGISHMRRKRGREREHPCYRSVNQYMPNSWKNFLISQRFHCLLLFFPSSFPCRILLSSKTKTKTKHTTEREIWNKLLFGQVSKNVKKFPWYTCSYTSSTIIDCKFFFFALLLLVLDLLENHKIRVALFFGCSVDGNTYTALTRAAIAQAIFVYAAFV